MVLDITFSTTSKWLFLSLATGGLAPSLLLLIIMFTCSCFYNCWHLHKNCCAKEAPISETECPPCLKKCGGCLRPFLIWGSRKLIVMMLPGLFKEHKDQSSNRTAARVFLLFLDKKVEKNFVILFQFFLLALAIFTSALLLFSRHVPVDISSECHKRDDEFRNLFCYTNESTWPVDCDTYNSTELEETEFVCYAISILELGIAIAAVLALAKIATVCITVYIRVSEAVYMWSRGNTRRCLCCRLSANRSYAIYHGVTFAILELLAVVYSVVVAVLTTDRLTIAEGRQSNLAYLAYSSLPIILIPGLAIVSSISTFGKHCDQVEYSGYSPDQLPSCVNDCDVYVESGNDRDGLEDPIFHSNTTVVENVDSRPVIFAVPTEQAGRERHNDNSAAPNDTDSGLVINNTSYLTPLLQDHLFTQTGPQPPYSQA